MSTLLLNADMQPVSLLPLSTVDWQEAIRYLVLDKVEVLEWHDNWMVHSANWETRVPAVIMLREYQKPKSTMRLSKRNIFLRDEYVCQYCGTHVSDQTATLDHVHPVSQGGKTTWENSVTACKPCNYRKGSKLQKPIRAPFKPDYYSLINQWKNKPIRHIHPGWLKYLGMEEAVVNAS